jgi:arabinonate dehydratase
MNDQSPVRAETPRIIRLNVIDNVVVAASKIASGTALESEGVTTATDIPSGHKIATRAIPEGGEVRKYGQIIGFASADIAPGDHVHTQNCVMGDFARDYAFGAEARPTDFVPEGERATFQGIVRHDGRVATRNYIAVVSTVNCSATVARMIAAHFTPERLAAFANVDGVAAFVHGTGCGLADAGEGFETLQRTMWGYVRHANCAGVLLVGLGCEVNQIRFLMEAYDLDDDSRFQHMTIQEWGGTRKAVEEGVRRVEAMLPAASAVKRETVSAGHLCLALQCGGSDAYSGITANPALGAAADLLVRHGGTAILAETPEIYGAEHLLTRRAPDRKVGEKLVERIRWWEDYTARNGGNMNNNPSPGNKAGGLTTILEKSLGAAAKGGTTDLVGVYKYAEPVTARGFVFMDSPGYDPASITGEVASGANIVCFTTGRGSVFGFKPAPSVKLATNTPMYERMAEDMDINCGEILSGGVSVAEMGQRIFDLLLEVASGKASKSEELGFGDNEFTPWVIGATM